MKRDPVIERGRLIGHTETRAPFYIKVRDNRGYESVMLISTGPVFVPVERQRNLLED